MRQHSCLKKTAGILVLLIALFLCVCACAEIVESGSCGKSASWTLDDSGKLVISGTGDTDGCWTTDRIRSVVIENGITSLGNQAFENCTGLQSVIFPNSITRIGEWAFHGCTGLKGITLPSALKTIDDCAFFGCANLTGITLPAGLKTLGNCVFDGCTALTSVTVPSGVTSLGRSIFRGCGSLKNAAVLADINNIEFPELFEDCPKLSGITVPSGSRNYRVRDGVVLDRAGTSLLFCLPAKSGAYSIPASVNNIAAEAFRNCAGLTAVTIPEGVRVIPGACFSGCRKLKSVSLPLSLRSVYWEAFKGCPLKEIALYGKISDIDENAFDKKVVIRAPKGSYAAQWAKDNHYTVRLTAAEYYVDFDYYSGDYGTVSASPARGPEGTEVTLKAKPKKGWKLTGWNCMSGGVTVKNNKFRIGKENVSLVPVFEADPAYAAIKGLEYKLDLKKKTAVVTGPVKKTVTSASIPAAITARGIKYKVTEIAANAFKNCGSLAKVTIGKNIKKIGKNAFSGCKKLKTITIKTTKLTKKGIGSNSFKNIHKTASFKLPKKQKKNYRIWLARAGKAPKKAKYK